MAATAAAAAAAAAPSVTCPRRLHRKKGTSGARRGVVVRGALTRDDEDTRSLKRGSFTFVPEQSGEWDEDSNRLRFSKPEGVTRVTAPPDAPPIVILPGFGNDSVGRGLVRLGFFSIVFIVFFIHTPRLVNHALTQTLYASRGTPRCLRLPLRLGRLPRPVRQRGSLHRSGAESPGLGRARGRAGAQRLGQDSASGVF